MILHDSIPLVIHSSQVVLCIRVALFCGKTKPLRCFFIIFRNSQSVVVHHSQVALGSSVALFCQRQEYNACRFIVPFLDSIYTILESVPKCDGGTAKEEKKCQKYASKSSRFFCSLFLFTTRIVFSPRCFCHTENGALYVYPFQTCPCQVGSA